MPLEMREEKHRRNHTPVLHACYYSRAELLWSSCQRHILAATELPVRAALWRLSCGQPWCSNTQHPAPAATCYCSQAGPYPPRTSLLPPPPLPHTHLQVEGGGGVPRGCHQLQRQGAVHPATDQHRHTQRGSIRLHPGEGGCREQQEGWVGGRVSICGDGAGGGGNLPGRGQQCVWPGWRTNRWHTQHHVHAGNLHDAGKCSSSCRCVMIGWLQAAASIGPCQGHWLLPGRAGCRQLHRAAHPLISREWSFHCSGGGATHELAAGAAVGAAAGPAAELLVGEVGG